MLRGSDRVWITNRCSTCTLLSSRRWVSIYFPFRDNSEEVGLCRRQRRLFTVLDDPEVSVIVVDGALVEVLVPDAVEVVLLGVAGLSGISVSPVILFGIVSCESESSESVPLE